jgi:hypothetical protein
MGEAASGGLEIAKRITERILRLFLRPSEGENFADQRFHVSGRLGIQLA